MYLPLCKVADIHSFISKGTIMLSACTYLIMLHEIQFKQTCDDEPMLSCDVHAVQCSSKVTKNKDDLPPKIISYYICNVFYSCRSTETTKHTMYILSCDILLSTLSRHYLGRHLVDPVYVKSSGSGGIRTHNVLLQNPRPL